MKRFYLLMVCSLLAVVLAAPASAAFIFADMVKESSVSTGTGTFSLGGAATGYRTFVAGVGDGNTCTY